MDNYEKLNDLIKLSKGNLISLSEEVEAAFEEIETYTHDQVLIIEEKYKITLPEQYKKFILKVGACKCFFDSTGLGLKFLPLEDIYTYMNQEFDDYLEEYPDLFLVVEHTRLGDAGFMRLNGTNLFSLIPHDECVSDWVNDKNNWVGFDCWLSKLLQSNGEESIT